MALQNSTGIGGPITVYAYGQNPANTSQWVYLTSPTSGGLAPLPGAGTQVPSFQLPANNCLYLPPLVSARVYLVLAGQTINLASNGASSGVAAAYPWTVNAANAGTVSAVWDFLEYTWYGPPGAFGMDTTQVDAIGIPLSFQAVNASGSPAASPLYGMKPRAISNLISDFSALGAPWTGLVQQTGIAGAPRVISPQHAANIPADSTTPGATPAPLPPPPANSPTFSTTYYDAILAQIWSTYQGSNFLYLSYPGQINAAYGVVDPNTRMFNFYSTASTSSALLAQIAFPTTWAVLNNAGAFANAGGSTPGGPNLATFIGRALVVSIERGTLPLPSGAPSKAQPFCGTTDWTLFYGGAATNGGMTPVSGFVTNWYASLLHKYGQAPVGGLPGLAYGFPDDDECQLPGGNAGQYAPYWQQPYTPGEQWNVTLNPM